MDARFLQGLPDLQVKPSNIESVYSIERKTWKLEDAGACPMAMAANRGNHIPHKEPDRHQLHCNAHGAVVAIKIALLLLTVVSDACCRAARIRV